MSWSPRLLKKLLELETCDDTWQIGTTEVEIPIERGQPAVTLLTVQGDGRVRSVHTVQRRPEPVDWLKLLKGAMLKPMPGMKPGRPVRVLAETVAIEAHLRRLAAPLGIEAAQVEELSELREAGAALASHAATRSRVIVSKHERDLHAAAARYIRLEPWERFLAEPTFLLELDGLVWPRPVAVVMGGAGETFGLAIYRDRDMLSAVHAAIANGGRRARGVTDSMAVWFERGNDVDPQQRRHVNRRDLPIAGDWHPIFARVRPGRDPIDLHRVEQAAVVQAALAGVTEWVEAYDRGDAEALIAGREGVDIDGGRIRCFLQSPSAFITELPLDERDERLLSTQNLHPVSDEPVAVGFMRLSLGEPMPKALPGSGEMEQLPMISIASTATGVSELMPVLREAEALGFARLVGGQGWILIASGSPQMDDEHFDVIYGADTAPEPMEAWLDAVEAANDQAVVNCFESDGVEPVFEYEGERLRGRYQVRVEGLTSMRVDFDADQV